MKAIKAIKAIPELSIDTKVIFDKLITMEENEIITFTEMSSIVGYNIQKKRGCYYSAIRKALNEHRFVFEGVTKVGIKRMSDSAIACDQTALNKIRRTAWLGRKKVHCIRDFNKLSNDEKIAHNTKAAILGVFEIMTRSTKIKKLETAIAQNNKVLPPAKTLELFK